MRHHLRMHVGLVVVIFALLGLSAAGVTIPPAVVYLVVLACPLMMIWMMLGMKHDGDNSSTDSAPQSDPAPR